MKFYFPVILMVLGTTLYHVAQKSVPAQINPVFSLVMNYISALLGTFLLLPLFPAPTAEAWSWKSINWASCAVGAAIVGVELSVLLAYRTGWKISLLSVIGNTASALLLVGIGIAFFHERVSVRNSIGIVLCLAGLALVAQN